MCDSTFLYGKSIADIQTKPYTEVLVLKIKYANELLDKLVRQESSDDYHRISAIGKAIKYNKELLYELGYHPRDVSNMIK